MTSSDSEKPPRDDPSLPGGSTLAIDRWEPFLHAFVQRTSSTPVSTEQAAGELSGVTLGVKDIIDVAGLPTRNGSETCAEASPAQSDAAVVAALRAAGTVVMGKTTTTEFAFKDPTDCRNPHDLSRSPGGSSSGSGAAVAAGLVDIALGTQTAGSLCRPAAYCGVVAYKPSFGLISTIGVTSLAPSFDTVGIIARSVEFAARAIAVIPTERESDEGKFPAMCDAAAVLFDTVAPVAEQTLDAFAQAKSALSGIAKTLREHRTEVDIAAVVADHGMVMNHEAAQAHGHLLADPRGNLLKPKFKAGLQAGIGITTSEADAARDRLSKARAAFWEELADQDVILTLPVPDGAPMMGETTGFQDWLTPWTVFGGPLVSLPWGLDALGRPRAVMLAGAPGADKTLLGVARQLEALAPPLPPPMLPD